MIFADCVVVLRRLSSVISKILRIFQRKTCSKFKCSEIEAEKLIGRDIRTCLQGLWKESQECIRAVQFDQFWSTERK